MILTLVLVSLSSVSAADIENNETIAISEIDSIDISQNKNTVTDEPVIGESLDDELLGAITPTLTISDASYTGNLNTGDKVTINVVLTASDNLKYHYGSKAVDMYLNGEKISSVSMTGDYSGKYTGSFSYSKFYTAGTYSFQAEIPAYQGYSESYNSAKSSTITYTVTGEDIDPSSIIPDYYLEIYEADSQNNKTTLYYDEIYTLDIYNKLYNNLGLSGSEVKNSLYQQGSGSYNPVYYYVDNVQTRDYYSNTVAVWVDGTSEAGSSYPYRNYWQWKPSATGIYEIYAVYSATPSLGELTSNKITVYMGVEPPQPQKTTTLTLSANSKINTTESITITPTVLDSDANPITKGTIKYFENNSELATKTNGDWSLTIASSDAGLHEITAIFSDDDYESCQNTTSYVALTPTTTELTLTQSEVGPGDKLIITPTVSNGDVTTGEVYIYDNDGNKIANTAPGVACEYEIPETTAIGNYEIYAVYQDDLTNYHASSRSENKNYKVKGYLTINVSINDKDNIVVGENTKLTFDTDCDVSVSVTPYQHLIGEDEAWDFDNISTGETFDVNFLTSDIGVSHVYVEFAGNDQYFASKSNNVTVKVLKSVTPTVSIVLNKTNLIVGDYVLITPKVTYNGNDVNVGNITLYRRYNYGNQETIAVINIGENTAYQIPSTEINTVYAVYNGDVYDENYYYDSAKGYSSELTVLNRNSISLSGESPVYTGTTATIKAILENAYKYYDNVLVYFYNGDESLGYASKYLSGTESNIELTKDITFNAPGIYNITARYSGDNNYAACNSSVLKITVIESIKDTNINLTINAENLMVGDSVEITPSVSYDGGDINDGSVTYSYANGTLIDTLNVTYPLTLNILKAGEYEITAKYNGIDGAFNPSATNATVRFTVKKYDINLNIVVDDVVYPNAPVAIITTDAAGDYTVYINGKKYDLSFDESELNSPKSINGEITPVGTLYNANVSITSGDKYNAVVNQTTFNVSVAKNNAQLSIPSQTTLPDKVRISIVNAIADTYTVKFNDSAIDDVILTVGEDGSAFADVEIPEGSYKATLNWTNANYNDVNEETTFEVLKQEVSSDIIKIRDNNYPANSTINLKTGESAVVYYLLNDDSSYSYVGKVELYINGQATGQSVSLTDLVQGSYAPLSKFSSTEETEYVVTAVYSYTMFSTLEETSNTIIYRFTKNSTGDENITKSSTELSLSDYDDGKSGVIYSEIRDLNILISLSSSELGSSVGEYANGSLVYLYRNGHLLGPLPLNEDALALAIISPITNPGWYNFTVEFRGNKYLNAANNATISYYLSDEAPAPKENYTTGLKLTDQGTGKFGIIESQIRDLNILISLSSSELGSSVGEYANASLVYLYQNGHLLYSLSLNGDSLALATISPITNPGWYNFTVEFRGNDKGLLPSNASISYYLINETTEDNTTVNKNASRLSISVDSTTVNIGDDITISYELTTGATGNITFRDGSTVLGTVNVGDKFTINNLTLGIHFIEAKYNGDDKFNESISNIVTVDVRALKNNLRISANNATYPDKVTVTVNADVDGNYNVSVNSEISTVTVTGGKGSVDLSLTPDEYTATVNFQGDGNYAANSASTTFRVSPQKPNFNAFSNPESIKLGEYVNLTSLADVNGNVTYTLPNGSKISSSVGDIVKFVPAVTGDNIVIAEFEAPYCESQRLNITVKVNDTREVPQMNVSVPDEVSVGEEISIIVKLSDDATGNITYTIDGNAVTLPVNQKLIIPTYNSGTKEIKVTYDGDDKYQSVSTVKTVRINKKESTVTVSILPDEIKVGDKVTIKANVSGSGNVTYTLNGISTTLPVGESLIINATVPGVNNLTIRYNGNNVYAPNSIDKTFNVKETPSSDIIVSAPDVEKYYGGTERFRVKVTDIEGNPIPGQLVEISIGGRLYNRTTNANGTATAPLGLNSGLYDVTVKVNDTVVNSTANILSTLDGSDVVMIYRNGSQYLATFKDSQGKLLAEGTQVEFNINGVFYQRNVRSNGIARLNLNLEHGNYVITALNTQTGERCANNITILSNIIENRDITKYYRNGTQYTVKVLGKDGNPIGKGKTVTFNINGMMYTRTTNNQSIAKMNINLQPGDYVITADYDGCKVSNKIKVLPVLSAKDLTKKYGNSEQFIATLVDGQGNPFAGEKVSFNINGVMYERTTNSNGQAKLNIKLQAGEYIITSSYKGANIANKVTVTA